jgi:tetratricopeptide (TPR) repeat protein
LGKAALLLRRALRLRPDAAEFHNNLGRVLHDLGRIPEAIDAYQRALTLQPRYAIALNNLAAAYLALGRSEEALACYGDALRIQPDYAQALNNVGALLHATGRSAEALDPLHAALRYAPDFPDAHANLARVLRSLGRMGEASQHIARALTMQPDNAAWHVERAELAREAGDYDEAVGHYRIARDLDATLGAAHAGLGRALQELGQLTEAAGCFERAIACEPKNPRHYLALARLGRLKRPSALFDAMLGLAEGHSALQTEARIDLHFALATLLADDGQPERAFEHLKQANALKRQTILYNEAARLGRMRRAAQVFSRAFLASHSGGGHPSEAPVFIIGMPRTGSTLVEQMLASHSEVLALGEVKTFRDCMAGLGLPFSHFPDSCRTWTRSDFTRLGVAWHERIQELQTSRRALRVTDKMLDNFRLVGLIHLALPHARFIHTHRDPVETCLSCFSIHFDKVPFSYDLGELGRYYQAYAEMMRHWHDVLPNGVILDVRYEDLVGDFEAHSRRILAFCRLEWQDACLRFHETNRPVRTASVVQVRQPLYTHASGRWRLPPEAIRGLTDTLWSVPPLLHPDWR